MEENKQNIEVNNQISTSEIENFLKRRLGDQEAAEIMEYIEEEIDKNINARVKDVQDEIILWRKELKNEFATKEDADVLQKKLVKRVSAVEGTIILWGFVFWITLILAVYIIAEFVV